jgi:hypothetical protein
MSSSATKERIIAQLNGWASSIKNVFFSLDRYIPEVPVHMTWISPDERAHPQTYEGAQWRSLLSLNESIYREPGADWIFLVDDDTFINPHALNIFISTLTTTFLLFMDTHLCIHYGIKKNAGLRVEEACWYTVRRQSEWFLILRTAGWLTKTTMM